jgi:hypothetical protein
LDDGRPPLWSAEKRVNIRLDSPREVLYWTGLWGLTDQELRDAVAAAGTRATDVAAYLQKPIKGARLGPPTGLG